MQRHNINWTELGEPNSTLFNDVYFSKENGLQESKYVFLEGNSLAMRFQKTLGNFVIAETGFGTGLNFLACWQLFEKINNTSLNLEFITVEKYPLNKDQLMQAYKLWPELDSYSKQLINNYPDIYEGTVQIVFSEKVILTIIFDDACNAYAKRTEKIDAWFLDGFAPDKNLDMWSDNLFNEIGRLSYADENNATTFSTFTAASLVRKNLTRIGFNVEKKKGFGKKREMLIGTFKNQLLKYNTVIPAYFFIPKPYLKLKSKIAIIGAGLAGCSIAHEFSKFAIKTDIYEMNSDIALGSSGNIVGIAHPYLSMDANISDRFFTRGFLQIKQFLEQHKNQIEIKNQQSIEILDCDEDINFYKKLLSKRNIDESFARILLPNEASDILGVNINHYALFYPSTIAVSPKMVCELWLKLADQYHQLYYNHQLLDIKAYKHGWKLFFNNGKECEYEKVIFAGGYDQFKSLDIFNDITVMPSSGQVDVIDNQYLKSIATNSNYFIPFDDNKLLVGATFRDSTDLSNEFRLEDFKKNVSKLPFNVNSSEIYPQYSRVSTRCMSLDHLPIVGEMPNFDKFEKYYKDKIRKGVIDKYLSNCPYHDGLFLVTCFGSKGMSGSMIAAQLIRSLILGRSLPVSADIYKALHPARFKIRDYKKSK